MCAGISHHASVGREDDTALVLGSRNEVAVTDTPYPVGVDDDVIAAIEAADRAPMKPKTMATKPFTAI